jgi:hypothetical protein
MRRRRPAGHDHRILFSRRFVALEPQPPRCRTRPLPVTSMHASPELADQPARPWRPWPELLTLAGFGLTLVVFYPGVMNYDARYVYLDSQRGFYGDWQSPVMTWIWKVIDPVAPGSASMFLLIATLYWLSILVLSHALARRSLAVAIMLPLLALTPPLFAFVGIIWRDVLMAACWLLAVAMVFAATGRSRRMIVVQVVACALVVLGVLLRPNAVAAAPLLITYIVWPREFSFKRTALAFVPVMIALAGMVQLIYYGVFNATRQSPLHSIIVFDLGGITHFSGANPFPVTWTPAEMERLRNNCYDPVAWNSYWNGPCKFVMEKVEHEQKLFGTPALSRAWLDGILNHPAAYIEHRLVFAGTFLFGSHLGMWTVDIENPPRSVFADRLAFTTLRKLHDALQGTPVFQMVTWLVACIVLCVVAWRARATPDGAFTLATCGSGVLYVLSYLPLGVACEFRYVYWTVLASAAGLAVVLLPTNDAKVAQPETATAS